MDLHQRKDRSSRLLTQRQTMFKEGVIDLKFLLRVKTSLKKNSCMVLERGKLHWKIKSIISIKSIKEKILVKLCNLTSLLMANQNLLNHNKKWLNRLFSNRKASRMSPTVNRTLWSAKASIHMLRVALQVLAPLSHKEPLSCRLLYFPVEEQTVTIHKVQIWSNPSWLSLTVSWWTHCSLIALLGQSIVLAQASQTSQKR